VAITPEAMPQTRPLAMGCNDMSSLRLSEKWWMSHKSPFLVGKSSFSPSNGPLSIAILNTQMVLTQIATAIMEDDDKPLPLWVP
jgi:hypothetical protein